MRTTACSSQSWSWPGSWTRWASCSGSSTAWCSSWASGLAAAAMAAAGRPPPATQASPERLRLTSCSCWARWRSCSTRGCSWARASGSWRPRSGSWRGSSRRRRAGRWASQCRPGRTSHAAAAAAASWVLEAGSWWQRWLGRTGRCGSAWQTPRCDVGAAVQGAQASHGLLAEMRPRSLSAPCPPHRKQEHCASLERQYECELLLRAHAEEAAAAAAAQAAELADMLGPAAAAVGASEAAAAAGGRAGHQLHERSSMHRVQEEAAGGREAGSPQRRRGGQGAQEPPVEMIVRERWALLGCMRPRPSCALAHLCPATPRRCLPRLPCTGPAAPGGAPAGQGCPAGQAAGRGEGAGGAARGRAPAPGRHVSLGVGERGAEGSARGGSTQQAAWGRMARRLGSRLAASPALRPPAGP